MASRSAPSGVGTVLSLDLSNPYYCGTRFLQDRFTFGRLLAIRHHNGSFYRYDAREGYHEAEVATLRADLYAYASRARKDGTTSEYCKPTTAKVSDILDALRALSHWPVESPPPCWLEPGHAEDPFDLLPCANGILHLPTRRLLPSTPQLFALNGLSFSFSASAPSPSTWLRFLHQLLPDDIDAQALLQEWLGYLLTARTHFQKILMVVGPKRSGKGTIGRIIRELVGRRHLVAPTLSNLGEQFGRASLIDKPVAVIADARLSGRTDISVLSEVLLSISGEDVQSIPRKNINDWHGVLPTRFTILTNEIPRILDASGALASRFLLLLFQESFYGREDHALFAKLQSELPGILIWALDGLARLTARGHFVQPQSAAEALVELENLSSPVMAFVRDECLVQSGLTCSKDVLYQAYRAWGARQGQSHVDTKATFCRNLWAALPFIGDSLTRTGAERTPVFRGLALRSDLTTTDSYVA